MTKDELQTHLDETIKMLETSDARNILNLNVKAVASFKDWVPNYTDCNVKELIEEGKVDFSEIKYITHIGPEFETVVFADNITSVEEAAYCVYSGSFRSFANALFDTVDEVEVACDLLTFSLARLQEDDELVSYTDAVLASNELKYGEGLCNKVLSTLVLIK